MPLQAGGNGLSKYLSHKDKLLPQTPSRTPWKSNSWNIILHHIWCPSAQTFLCYTSRRFGGPLWWSDSSGCNCGSNEMSSSRKELGLLLVCHNLRDHRSAFRTLCYRNLVILLTTRLCSSPAWVHLIFHTTTIEGIFLRSIQQPGYPSECPLSSYRRCPSL